MPRRKAALRWRLTWGKDIEFLEALAAEDGEVPQALEDEPVLDDYLDSILSAFFAISPSRMIGMAPSGISLAEIEAYCRMFGVDDVERFVRFMRCLDAEFLFFVSERSKQDAK